MGGRGSSSGASGSARSGISGGAPAQKLTADQLAAKARIEAHMAQLEANKTKKPTPPPNLPAVAGWSNASRQRAGRPTRSREADYGRGYTQSGDTQTWDWS